MRDNARRARSRLSGAEGVADDEVDPPLPEARWVVVAHPLDQLEAGPRDQLGRAAATDRVDQLVLCAVDHQRRDLDAAQAVGPRAGGTDGEVLPGGAVG